MQNLLSLRAEAKTAAAKLAQTLGGDAKAVVVVPVGIDDIGLRVDLWSVSSDRLSKLRQRNRFEHFSVFYATVFP